MSPSSNLRTAFMLSVLAGQAEAHMVSAAVGAQVVGAALANAFQHAACNRDNADRSAVPIPG